MNREWLDGLQVGDKVLVEVRSFNPRILKVERFTKTQIIASGQRFRRDNGRSVSLEDAFIRPVDAASLEEIKYANLKAWLNRTFTNTRTVPSIFVLRAVKKAYDEAIEEESITFLKSCKENLNRLGEDNG